ncbi:MAG: isopeptide-forming domain-containing fimbrial protein, partial [Planctomycetia bacterium]
MEVRADRHLRGDLGLTPTESTDTAANSLTWSFGTFQDSLDRPARTDILFTVTATNRPFADGLLLTNQAEQTERNETGDVLTSNTALAQVKISEPLLDITKGVVSTNNPAGVFTPPTVAPAGVTFSQPGQSGAAFTGTVTSSGLATTPIDSNLSNVLGADRVKFCIVVENTGSGVHGAFDVAIRDTFDPTKFRIPTSGPGLNLQVTDGAGTTLAFVGNQTDFFGSGITLVDPSTPAGPVLTTFGSGSGIGSSPPEWDYDGNTSELTLLANNSSNYWQQASFGSKDITGATGVSLQASFLQTYGFTSSNDSFRVRLTSGSSGIPKAEATFNFLDFQGAQSKTITKPFTHVDSNFDYGDVQEIYLIGDSNVQYGAVLAGVQLDRLTAVLSAPGPSTSGSLSPGKTTGGTVIDTGTNIAVITYDLELLPTVAPLDVIPNTATLTNYASQEGGPNFLPPAGLSDKATVTVQSPRVTKTLEGTSIVDTFNTNTQGVIGELATFELFVEVPRGTTPSAVVVDSLPTGLAFVGMVGSPVVDTGVSFTGSATPVVTNSGRTVTFNLGDVVNANADDQLHGITVRYEAVVLNVSSNIAGKTLTNNAKLTWTGHNELPPAKSQPVTVIEPKLTIDKRVSPLTAQAGDVVTYTIVVAASQTTAHNVEIADFLPGGITYIDNSLAHVGGVAPTTLGMNPGRNFTAAYTTLTPGQTSTLEFKARLDPGVIAGGQITNAVTETWTSLPGRPGQITPNNPNAYERTGSESTTQGQLNNYKTTDSAILTVAEPTVAKTLVTTSIVNASNSKTQAVIGETATYTVTMTIPQGRTPAAKLMDAMGLGMAYVRTVSVVNDDPTKLTVPGLMSAPVLFNEGRTATWNLGDIVNSDTDSSTDETITFTIETVVLNVNTNTSGVWLVNKAQAGWNNASISPVVEAEPIT